MAILPNRRLAATLLSLGVCVVLAGCGSETANSNPPRQQVSGTVTLDGYPAPSGTIEFIPLAQGQLQAQGSIQDGGDFSISAEDGPSVGDYKVVIQCAKKTGRKIRSMSSTDGSGTIEERIPIIPAQYNTATILKKTIESGENVFHFDLKSKL